MEVSHQCSLLVTVVLLKQSWSTFSNWSISVLSLLIEQNLHSGLNPMISVTMIATPSAQICLYNRDNVSSSVEWQFSVGYQ